MEYQNEDITLKDVLNKLLEYKSFLLTNIRTIFFITFFSSSLGFIISFFLEPEYNAELTFVVENAEGSANGLTGIASQFGFDITGGSSTTFTQENILELLKSRGVVVNALMQDAVINDKKDLLIEHYININSIRDSWPENLSSFSFQKGKTIMHDSISGVIWQQIIDKKLKVNLKTSEATIVELSYISISDQFAKYFVESLIAQMSKMYVKHQTAQAQHTLDFLQKRSDSVFTELKIAEEEFAKIKDINQRIIKLSGRLKELQLMRQVEVLSTMYLEITKNLELSKLTLLNNMPIINIIDKPTLPLKDDSISTIGLVIVFGFLGAFFSFCFFVVRKLFNDALLD